VDYRTLLAAVLALGLGGLVEISRADMVAVDSGIAVKESDVTTPARGMTMDQVASKFGAPVTKVPAVGKPPISRWEYPGFVVYFEHEHVIHSVVGTAPAADTAPATETAPAAAAPPAN
jgi:outer membrane protein assembly factor BamE (lipoprotein component of BamABCDE complex)